MSRAKEPKTMMKTIPSFKRLNFTFVVPPSSMSVVVVLSSVPFIVFVLWSLQIGMSFEVSTLFYSEACREAINGRCMAKNKLGNWFLQCSDLRTAKTIAILDFNPT